MGHPKNAPEPVVELLPQHRLFTTAYMMEMLDQKANAIYALCREKLIDHYKIKHLLYFDQDGIDDFLQRHKVKRLR